MSLQYLDIGIAIGVVMLAVSLLITILTQAAASVFSLRGSNLRWAIATLIRQVHGDHATHARQIAQDVLTHPLISDSTLSKFSRVPLIGWFCRRVSLANAVRLEELVGVLDVLKADARLPAENRAAMAVIATAAQARMSLAYPSGSEKNRCTRGGVLLH